MFAKTTSGAIAQILKAELVGSPDIKVDSLSSVDDGVPGALTFIRDDNFGRRWPGSGASVAIISARAATEECRAATGAERALLVVPDADLALIQLLEGLVALQDRPIAGVHATSVIDKAAVVDPTAALGPFCHVGARSTIGAKVVLRERVSIAEDCTVGDGCEFHPGVVLYPNTVVGRGVVLHAGVVLGADGFGYRPSADGKSAVKIPHVGNVVIEDGVEIGANSCVDRAKFGSTRVGAGTKIDNLVQVGHGVKIGRGVMLCAQVGLAGSSMVCDGANLGGQVGVADGVTVGPLTRIGAQAGIDSDVPARIAMFGTPAREFRIAFAESAFVSRLYRDRAKIMRWLRQEPNQKA